MSTDQTFLAQPLRVPEGPRRCPYCDQLAAADDLTCGGGNCLERQQRFEKAVREMAAWDEGGGL